MIDGQTPPDYSDPKILAQFRAKQRSRSVVMAVVLVALCVLFFAITIVKISAGSGA